MPRDWPRPGPSDPSKAILTAFERRTLETLRALQRENIGFLECGAAADKLYNALTRELDQIVPSASAAAAAAAAAALSPSRDVIVRFSKVEMDFLRKDASSGKDGSHWCILLQIGPHFVLIDLTWLQFDLPIRDAHADYRTALERYPSILATNCPFIARGFTAEEAIAEWRSFLMHRTYIQDLRRPVLSDYTSRAGS